MKKEKIESLKRDLMIFEASKISDVSVKKICEILYEFPEYDDLQNLTLIKAASIADAQGISLGALHSVIFFVRTYSGSGPYNVAVDELLPESTKE